MDHYPAGFATGSGLRPDTGYHPSGPPTDSPQKTFCRAPPLDPERSLQILHCFWDRSGSMDPEQSSVFGNSRQLFYNVFFPIGKCIGKYMGKFELCGAYISPPKHFGENRPTLPCVSWMGLPPQCDNSPPYPTGAQRTYEDRSGSTCVFYM